MTSLVETASISHWKNSLSNFNSDLDTYPGVDQTISSSGVRRLEMIDIPTWKQEPMSKRNNHLFQDSKKTCVFDSSAISSVIDTSNDDYPSLHEPFSDKSEETIIPVEKETSACNMISVRSNMNQNTQSSEVNVKKGVRSGIETSHLKHVHSNPFFVKLGVDHPHGSESGDVGEAKLSNGLKEDDSDMQEEYAPNSGFVDKLRLKFAKLNQSSGKSLKGPRRFASLESLIEVGKSKREVKSSFDKSDKRIQRTDENITKVGVSPSTKIRSAPKPPVHPSKGTSGESISVKATTKHDQHISSDFSKGRDNIVIIEHDSQPKSLVSKKTIETVESGTVKPIKDSTVTDLPKPNTVINFRSIFEKRVTRSPKLPDFYASKFNLQKGRAPPKPPLPPRRTNSHDNTVMKAKEESVSDEMIDKNDTEALSITESNSLEIVESAPSQSVKDLSMLFKQKPERPFESPKSKRRSPEKKAIFDSSAITPLKNEVKEEDIVRSIPNEKKGTLLKSNSLDKPAAPIRKPERINKPRPTLKSPDSEKPESPIKTKTFQDTRSITTIEVRNIEKDVPASPTQNSPSLFPNRKQIFDSSNLSGNASTTPVAPPRVKQQKRNTAKKQASPPQSPTQVVTIKTQNISADEEQSDFLTKKLTVEEINARNKQKEKEAEKRLIEIAQNSTKVENKKQTIENNKANEVKISDSNNAPTRGLPSVIARRLNKTDNTVNLGRGIIVERTKDDSSDEEVEQRLVKPSNLRPVKSSSQNVPNKKDDSISSETFNFKNVLKSAKNDQVPRTNIDDLIGGKRNKKPAAVFDSSNIAPSPKPATNGVPPLNLSDLVSDQPLGHPYQEGYIPTKIGPCGYVFEGAGVKLKTTPLLKRRKEKGKIKFHDDHKFHEYQSEDAALKDYLEQNPHETEEVTKQEEAVVMTLGGSFGDESSDDVDEPVTPREDASIKSNTPLGHSSGEFTNYKSKYQTEEFQFGMSFSEPEQEQKKTETKAEDFDAENMDLRPADEDSTINYTDSSISDMLF